jgi:hypothetical protein
MTEALRGQKNTCWMTNKRAVFIGYIGIVRGRERDFFQFYSNNKGVSYDGHD